MSDMTNDKEEPMETTEPNLADQKAREAYYADKGWDPLIPAHPQPGFFETTVVQVPIGTSGIESRQVTAAEVEEILSQPAWNVRDLRLRVDARMATEKRTGWGKPTKKGRYHYFEPVEGSYAEGWAEIQAVCGAWGGNPPPKNRVVYSGEPHGITLHRDLDDDARRCVDCSNRLRLTRTGKPMED